MQAALQAAGYRVRLGANLHDQHHVFAGTAQARIAALQALLDDPDVRAIFFARGGYGTGHLLPHLDWTGFRAAPKWLIGYSDLTLLLNTAVNQGVASVHGPMAFDFSDGNPPQGWAETLALLQTTDPRAYWKAAGRFSSETSPVLADYPVLGGNLTLFQSLLGTPYLPAKQAFVLFVEDIAEYLYATERRLEHLKWALQGRIRGVVAGEFANMQDNPEPFGKSLDEILQTFAQELDIPFLGHFPSGHLQAKYPVLLG
jgi:muramoyltetrapeptide carboxypeptidase